MTPITVPATWIGPTGSPSCRVHRGLAAPLDFKCFALSAFAALRFSFSFFSYSSMSISGAFGSFSFVWMFGSVFIGLVPATWTVSRVLAWLTSVVRPRACCRLIVVRRPRLLVVDAVPADDLGDVVSDDPARRQHDPLGEMFSVREPDAGRRRRRSRSRMRIQRLLTSVGRTRTLGRSRPARRRCFHGSISNDSGACVVGREARRSPDHEYGYATCTGLSPTAARRAPPHRAPRSAWTGRSAGSRRTPSTFEAVTGAGTCMSAQRRSERLKEPRFSGAHLPEAAPASTHDRGLSRRTANPAAIVEHPRLPRVQCTHGQLLQQRECAHERDLGTVECRRRRGPVAVDLRHSGRFGSPEDLSRHGRTSSPMSSGQSSVNPLSCHCPP